MKTHFELIGGPQDGRIEPFSGGAFVAVNDPVSRVRHEYDWESNSWTDGYPHYRALFRRTVHH